jgi:SAM-dependent methyltransferase
MRVKIRIGKPGNFLLDMQPNLMSEIDKHISEEDDYVGLYLENPIREVCIICAAPLAEKDFARKGIEFSFCERCGHINGNHVANTESHLATYQELSLDIMNYAESYLDSKESFVKKIKDIYLPKALFLKEVLEVEMNNAELLDLEILDFGTGSGHMVGAISQLGFTNITGIDPMKPAIVHGRDVMGVNKLEYIAIEDSINYLRNTTAKVVLMLCSIPHVENHHEIMDAIKLNQNIKFILLKVPMFSLSSTFDVAHPKINSRVLSGTHTHLYTESSIRYLEETYELSRIAEWRFGSDFLDLYRHLQIICDRAEFSERYKNEISEKMLPILDKFQHELDSHNFSSELHLVWKLHL